MATIWRVTNYRLARLSPYSTDVIAYWKFNCGSTTDKFRLWWEWWSTSQGKWILGTESSVSVGTDHYEQSEFQATWTPPSEPDATLVRVTVDPIPKSGSKWKHGSVYIPSIPNPNWEDAYGEALEAPTVSAVREQDGSVTVSWGEPPELAASIVIFGSDDGGPMSVLRTFPASGTLDISGHVIGRYFSATLRDGHTYSWSGCWQLADKKTRGLTSTATDTFEARPLAPTDLTARAVSGTSVRLDWVDHGISGDTWRVEGNTNPEAWDDHMEPQETWEATSISPDDDGRNWYTVDGLEAGTAYWFRVVRVSEEAGDSDWATSGSSEQVRCVAGTPPQAPTLAAVPSCAPIDEPLRLAWTHNSEDGSAQTAYQVEITAGGSTTTLSGTTASSVTITPSTYSVTDGSTITWRVRTQGATEQWAADGGWSQSGTIIVWAKPTSTITVDATVDELPFDVTLAAGATATANAPTRMWLAIVCVSGHTAIMPDGTERWVPAGELVWEGEAVPGEDGCTVSGWSVSLGAMDVRLESGQEYEARGGCMTAQGMVSEATPAPFDCDVSQTDVTGCDCTATLDPDTLAAVIHPTCTDGPEGHLVADVVLSMWKVTSDGIELIADGLPNDGESYCVDRHPSFGTCTYRVVATDVENGGQGFSDATFRWKGPGIVVQWDEGWVEPSSSSDGITYSGNRLVLPYNVDIAEQWEKESSLNMWSGNRHPVSRYGTQVGHTATWTCVLNKYAESDEMERVKTLAEYMGDVHVREPYGSSYMAHIQVSLQETHGEAAVPVTFIVTRVEE